MTDDLDARRARRRTAHFKRPRRILGMWARLALSVGIIAVSVFMAACLVAKAVKPYQEASHQKVQLAETQQQSELLAAQNIQLERRIAYLKTPGGVASEARRIGYLRPGEYPIVVEGLNGSPDTQESQTEMRAFAPSAPQISPMRRFWRHLSGH
ncbi:MAG: FtsB family cell division protein [Janthinobacterium lividum]